MDYFMGTSKESGPQKGLRVRIGPSRELLTTALVNGESVPHYIDSPYFQGHVLVRIKNFQGHKPAGAPEGAANEDYFGAHKRLFSVQVQGRFKHEYTAEDVVFGAEFENKVSPPTGTWVAIKFANLIDPALLTDVYAAKPWLYSPTLCAMNVVNVVPAPKGSAFSSPIPSVRTPVDKTGSLEGFTSGPDTAFSSRKQLEKSGSVSETTFGKGGDLPGVPSLGTWVPGEIKEDTSLLCSSGPTPFATDSIAGRRKAFQSQKLRRSTTLNPENVYNFEIFAPFIDLNTFDLTLGINVNLLKYLENQPITMMSKSLSTDIPFFVIEFDLVDKKGEDGASAITKGTSEEGEEEFHECS